MSRDAWLELMQNHEKLTRFFKNPNFDPNGAVSTYKLDATVYVELPYTNSADKVASLVFNGDEDELRSAVAFKETTWQHIINLEPLVTHLLTRYAGYAPQVMKIFDGMSHMVFNTLEYIRGRESQETFELISEILRKDNPEVFLNDDFDRFRVYEEIKMFCVKNIYEACKKAEQPY